jgi:imidazolonepropionase-like amidohydrolase
LRVQSDLGAVGIGKLADLVLLDANPLVDIRNSRKIQAVVCRGKVIGRAELDQLLAQAAIEAQES